MTRRMWLDRAAREGTIASMAGEAGFARHSDRPRCHRQSRQLVFRRGEVSLVLDAYHDHGCQLLSLLGEPDDDADALWRRLARELPRYESHVEDAGSEDSRRLLLGLRQWVVATLLDESKDHAVVDAVTTAAEHPEVVVRNAAYGAQAGVPGQIGGAFQFDGVNDYLSLGNVPEFNFTQSDSFTFEAWVNRFGNTSQGAQAVLHLNYSCSNTVQGLGLTATGIPSFGLRDSFAVSNDVTATTPLTNNTFYHLVGVREVAGSEKWLHLYVDGQWVATAPDTTSGGLASSAADFIGRRFACPDNDSFFGLIDEVRTYNRALTDVEVQARYVNADIVALQGQSIDFTALATDPAGAADPLVYQWDFGDGSAIQSGVNLTAVSHAFAAAGAYTVTLTVDDGDGGSDTRTLSVYIGNNGNEEPIADAGGPYEVNLGEDVVLDASGSTDPDGDTLTFVWDLDYDGVAFDSDLTGASPSFDSSPCRLEAIR